MTKFLIITEASLYICLKLVNAMNYNNLMFFVIAFCFASLKLSAQTIDTVQITPLTTTVIDVKPSDLNLTHVKDDNKVLIITNRHRDLINTIVNSKIKCAIDLFTIVITSEAC
ncbi:hypothetical protein FNB79_08185 [Formosa sediminum]|uniref:Uncharacterized protein n=1 Tax=Formosa sediminum TaxID=2594004 RepID=A0A516GR39_9FLAO|nr:hypothetical protein [Formosa sediminum]QDO93963.1 hypothetical protein FNB79_08185 [Formosa sediminum]